MTKPQNVLVWREFGNWGPRILDLMSDVLTPTVMENVKAEPPEYCYCDVANYENPIWLQDALDRSRVQAQAPLGAVLADRLSKAYSHVRVYHACRPTNIEDYYKNGLLPGDPKSLNELATRYFLNLPIVTRDTLNRAVKLAGEPHLDGHTSFAMDERIITKRFTHYLTYGSESLQVIAGRLQDMTGEDCLTLLKNIGIPTVFVCDVPISYVVSSVPNLSCELIETIFEEYIRPQEEFRCLDFTLKISVKLPPDKIVSHYHPEFREHSYT